MFALNLAQRRTFERARQFAATVLEPTALEWDERERLPVGLLRQAAKLGYGGLLVRPDVGGAGLGRLEGVLVYEGLAHGDPAIASFLSIHNMCEWIIDTYASDEIRQRWLPGLTSLEASASLCLTETHAGSDAAAVRTVARRSGDVYILSGAKSFITGGDHSTVHLVICRTDPAVGSAISALLVEGDRPGVSIGVNQRKMGWRAHPTTPVTFDAVQVPVGNLIGAEGEGLKIAFAALDGGRLNIAATSIGAGQAALNKAIDYMRQRTAFGRTLSAFQALQFKVADARTELEAARSLLYVAASKLERGEVDATVFCAKSNVSQRTRDWPRRMRRCSSTAATATCASMASKRSSATCAYFRSPKERTR